METPLREAKILKEDGADVEAFGAPGVGLGIVSEQMTPDNVIDVYIQIVLHLVQLSVSTFVCEYVLFSNAVRCEYGVVFMVFWWNEMDGIKLMYSQKIVAHCQFFSLEMCGDRTLTNHQAMVW